jgi:hypothetical protein
MPPENEGPRRPSRELLLEKQRQLEDSGRFTVTVLEPGSPGPDGNVKLRMELRELEVAPPLSANLSPEEAGLQQLRSWLLNWTNRGEDAVIQLKAGKSNPTNSLFAELLASPQGGLWFRLNTTGDSTPGAGWWFSVRSNVFALIDGQRREGIYSTHWSGSAKLQIALGVDPDECPPPCASE